MPSPVEETCCRCSHHSRDHEDWPMCSECNCPKYQEARTEREPEREVEEVETILGERFR